MLKKIITFLIRIAITFCIVALIVGSGHYKAIVNIGPGYVVFAGWIIGLLYAVFRFNKPYSFALAKATQSLEDELLKAKKLFDDQILTKEEFDSRIQAIKAKHL